MPSDRSSDEVEQAINVGSAEKSLETVKRVTELFLASAGSFNSEQIELFDSVLERLIKTIELRAIADVSARIALAETSMQLAGIAQAPPTVIRRLARHDEITVAGPVLTESSRLSAEDLVEIAETKSEQHLLAISGRWWLTEIVTDALLARHYPSVSRRAGQKSRRTGFGRRICHRGGAGRIRSRTRRRYRHPRRFAAGTAHPIAAQRDRRGARPAVVARAAAHVRGNPQFDRQGLGERRSRDGDAARLHRGQAFVSQLNASGKLNEATLFAFAKARKYEETVTALALLSKSSIEVIRPLMQSLRDDGVLVPCKVAGLSWEITSAILECRYSTGSMGPHELAKAKSQFAKINLENAQRLLKFWQVRSTAAPTKLNERHRAVHTVNRAPSFPLIVNVRTAPGVSPLISTGIKCSVRPCVGLSINTLR